jgi:hypothetical protein
VRFHPRAQARGFPAPEIYNGVVENEGITFRGFTVDPHDSNIVYAAAEISSWVWAGQERIGREFDMTAGVVYRSTDGGNTWQPINDGLRMRTVNQLALTPDGASLYAATEGEGVYRLEIAR